MTQSSTAPAEPLAPWIGGKRLLASRIINLIEETPHNCYAEPFVGMGGVFLRRRHRPACEAINDLNGDIVNLFRIVREHPDELKAQFRWAIASRADYRRLVETPPHVLTDIQRAARFVYLQRLSFAGIPASRATPGNVALSAHDRARFRAEQVTAQIRRCHERLQGVHIECLDWQKFLGKYDRPSTLFYLDPPYWGHEADYGKGIFGRDDFARMAESLRSLKGRFILSLNDKPEVRELFAGFKFREVEVRYTANAKASRRASELLISGA